MKNTNMKNTKFTIMPVILLFLMLGLSDLAKGCNDCGDPGHGDISQEFKGKQSQEFTGSQSFEGSQYFDGSVTGKVTGTNTNENYLHGGTHEANAKSSLDVGGIDNRSQGGSVGPITIDASSEECPTIPVVQPSNNGYAAGSGNPRDYGTRITSLDLRNPIRFGWSMNYFGYQAHLSAMKKYSSKSWKSKMKKMISSPTIRANFGQLGDGVDVKYYALERNERVTLNSENLVGFLPIDSKFNSKYPVVPTDFLAYSYIIARDYGANRVFLLESFEQLRLKASSSPTLGGVVGAATGCVTAGSISLNLGGSKKFGVDGRAGAFFVLYREDTITRTTQFTGTKAKIDALKEAIRNCPDPNLHNAGLRMSLGSEYLRAGNIAKAIENYEIAYRDLVNGKENRKKVNTLDLKLARELMAKVLYNWSLAIRMQHGEEAQFNFARKVGLRVVPTRIEELKNYIQH